MCVDFAVQILGCRRLPIFAFLFWLRLLFFCRPGSAATGLRFLAPAPQAQALVARALATELRTAQDTSHPMRYQLRKSTPRLTSTKEILETKDGDVARLVLLFDKPLSQVDEQTEEARLNALLNDPSLQKHRKQGEEGDMAIVLRLLRMLPDAFLYTYAGSGGRACGRSGEVHAFGPTPTSIRLTFETQALTAMTGVLSIDAAQERVTRLEGHLEQDTDYGWGVLGKLDKGGSIVIEQARCRRKAVAHRALPDADEPAHPVQDKEH
jgi:hypothetical protein